MDRNQSGCRATTMKRKARGVTGGRSEDYERRRAQWAPGRRNAPWWREDSQAAAASHLEGLCDHCGHGRGRMLYRVLTAADGISKFIASMPPDVQLELQPGEFRAFSPFQFCCDQSFFGRSARRCSHLCISRVHFASKVSYNMAITLQFLKSWKVR